MPIRKATLDDFDNFLELVLKTLPDDPDWYYRFPYYKEYPEDYLKFTSILFKFFLDPSHDDFEVMVSETSKIGSPNEIIMVSWAVWDKSYLNKRKYGSGYKPQNGS